MIVIQPLIQGLRGTGLYSRVYEGDDGHLKVEIGKKTKSFWEKDKVILNLIFGNPLTKADVIYTLLEDKWEKEVLSNSLGDADINKIEGLIDSCYNFEETHKVTEFKN